MAAFDPDAVLHIFCTPFGIPPDDRTPPICGSVLTQAYDWPTGPRRPYCYRCDLAKRRIEAGLAAVPEKGWRAL